MPGLTDNTTIIAADNQVIVTQNEQTVELDAIEQAILGLSVKLEEIKITIAGTSSGTGGSGSAGASGIEDLIGIDPIEDFTGQQMSDRCRLSNYIYDCVYSVIDAFDDTDFSEFATAGAVLSSDIVVAIIATVLLTPIAGIIAVAITSCVVILVMQSISLTSMLTAMSTAKSDIINNLFNSTDIYQAKNAFMNNISGLSAGQSLILSTLLTNDLLKTLFIDNFELPADYTPTEPCEDATPANLSYWRIYRGFENHLPVRSGANWIEFDSVEYSVQEPGQADNGYQYLWVHNINGDSSVSGLRFTGTGVTSLSEGLHFYTGQDWTGTYYQDGTPPIVYDTNVCRALQARTTRYSSETITLRIEIL